jgi:hypothetical protein
MGWTIAAMPDGTAILVHTDGTFVAGFDSKAEAGVWLQSYLLALMDQERRAQRARERLLARMAPHGRVS